MRWFDPVIRRLSAALHRTETEFELIQTIDHAILDPVEPLDTILRPICDQIKDLCGARAVQVYVSTGQGYRAMWNVRSELPEELPKVFENNIGITGRDLIFERLPQVPNLYLMLLPLRLDGGLFGVVALLLTKKQRERVAETPEFGAFTKLLSNQLGILVGKVIEVQFAVLQENLIRIFFKTGLKPTECYRQIVAHVAGFLPGYHPLKLTPPPTVQLVLYHADKPFLTLFDKGNSPTDLDIDSSVCGNLVKQKKGDFLVVDPTESDLYKGFDIKSKRPHSELAVKIQDQGRLLGVLNLEHPKRHAFLPPHINAMRSAANFLGPFLGALRDRYESQQAKERGILYTVNFALDRLAHTYEHLIGQVIPKARLRVEDLQKRELGLPDDVMDAVRGISRDLDAINDHSERFCRSLPQFLNYGATAVAQAVQNALKGFDLKNLGEQDRIEISCSRMDTIPNVYASTLLQEHIFNLLNNSIHALRGAALGRGFRKRGRIQIDVSVCDVTDALNQPVGSRRVTIRISDNGPGAPKRHEKHLGRAGYTTKGRDGSGYGLASVREYCHSLGGNLVIENRPFKGSGFAVDIWLQVYDPKRHEDPDIREATSNPS